MKLFLIFTISILVSIIGFSQTATDISIQDTRSTNLPPLSYSWLQGSAGIQMRTRFDFKLREVLGVPGSGYYSTLMTIPQWGDNSGDKMHQLNFNNGGIFYRQGVPSATNWEHWQKLVLENENGNVGIGTISPTEKLSVNGNVRAKKLIVTQTGWPDYVFSNSYKIIPINDLAIYISKNKHLPSMPSAIDVEENGLDVGQTQAELLKKIEELTLYVIEMNAKIHNQQKEILNLKKAIKRK